MKTDNTTPQRTVDHLGTVILNVVRTNKPWKQDDLRQLADYVKTSNIDQELQRPILIAIVQAAEEAAKDAIENSNN